MRARWVGRRLRWLRLREVWREVRLRAVGLLGRWFLGLYFAFVRCRREGAEHFLRFREAGTPVIFVFWHAHLLSLVRYHRKEGAVVLVSDHRDGEYITRVILQHGFGAARGSSTRGGVKGLKGILRAAREGRDLAITPDGPRGPRQVFKRGALTAAQLSGLPIILLGVGADRAWHLRSWDRFVVPKPFSTVRIRYLPPRWIPREAPPGELDRIARELEEELRGLALALDPKEARLREEDRGKGGAPGEESRGVGGAHLDDTEPAGGPNHGGR